MSGWEWNGRDAEKRKKRRWVKNPLEFNGTETERVRRGKEKLNDSVGLSCQRGEETLEVYRILPVNSSSHFPVEKLFIQSRKEFVDSFLLLHASVSSCLRGRWSHSNRKKRSALPPTTTGGWYGPPKPYPTIEVIKGKEHKESSKTSKETRLTLYLTRSVSFFLDHLNGPLSPLLLSLPFPPSFTMCLLNSLKVVSFFTPFVLPCRVLEWSVNSCLTHSQKSLEMT